jgi:hypothetical protein
MVGSPIANGLLNIVTPWATRDGPTGMIKTRQILFACAIIKRYNIAPLEQTLIDSKLAVCGRKGTVKLQVDFQI